MVEVGLEPLTARSGVRGSTNRPPRSPMMSCVSDFIWPLLPPYMGVIPNPKMAFIFPISCIFALIFPLFMKYFPKCEGKGSFPKSQIKSLCVPAAA